MSAIVLLLLAVTSSAKPEPSDDRGRAVQRLEWRVQKVVPIVHPQAKHVDRATGAARVRFWITPRGYAKDAQVVRSSGNHRFDRAALEAVRFAEPLAYVPGWIEIDVGAGPS
jgi:TonB family protein